MKKQSIVIASGFILLLSACSSSKTYFTSGIRARIENNHQDLQKIQFYVDRDIVLRRDLQTGETKVTSGKVKMENGHYVNIVTLKKGTPGVCTVVKNNVMGIAFEQGDNKYLTFGKTKFAKPDDPYRVLANEWINDYGVINYDGKVYHIQSAGTEASIMIKTRLLKKSKVEEREMTGRKLSDSAVK